MIEVHFRAEKPADLKLMLMDYLAMMKGVDINGAVSGKPLETIQDAPPLAELPVEEPEPVKPVLTQEQMAKNVANAPEHKEPEQPTIEEVRAALKALRDRKGSEAVKELLKAYGAGSLPELKPEDYLGARDRAMMEV